MHAAEQDGRPNVGSVCGKVSLEQASCLVQLAGVE